MPENIKDILADRDGLIKIQYLYFVLEKDGAPSSTNLEGTMLRLNPKQFITKRLNS